MKFILATPKKQPTAKPIQKRIDETPKVNDSDSDGRQQALARAIPLMDSWNDINEKYISDFNEDSVISLQREFNRVAKTVLLNIVPKTTKIKLGTRYNDWGINRYGPARKHQYSSRYDSLEMYQLFGSDTDLTYDGYSDDEGNKLPKEYRGISDARKWIKASIEAIKTAKFRTRKRSITRLQKLEKFLESYEDILKQQEGRYEVELGKKLVYAEAPYYSHKNAGWRELDTKIVVNSGTFYIVAYEEDKNNPQRADSFEFRWSSASNEFPEAIAWGSIQDDLEDIFNRLKAKRQDKLDKINEANEELRKHFAKEILVAKTKEMRV